ncbi:MAG: DUF554 domain-containing protein [Cyanothece sp. SIO2G6]|nr:DUF554 domain-containing protein [Cyanothece sp. SIO2G6]
MAIEIWAKTSGTWINVLTVLTGTTLGLLLRQRLPQAMQTIITQGVGLLTLWLGVSMASQLTTVPTRGIDGVVLGLIILILGGILGEWWQLEAKLNGLGDWLKHRFQGKGRFTEGFVSTSLLFCIGPMSILGSLNNGLTGNNTILVLKATMDGLVSIPLASTYGIGVGFSILPIIVYQGGLSLLSSLLGQTMPDAESNPYILMVTGIGGLMILAIGLSLLDVAKIRLASFLPAIALAPLIYWIFTLISGST